MTHHSTIMAAVARAPGRETGALSECLLRLRRRWLALGGLAALAWGLVAATALLLLCVWLDLLLELPPELRCGLSGIALLGGIALLTWAYRGSLRRAAPQPLARRLDDLARTGGQVLSGVDLLLQPPAPSPLTVGMAQLAVGRAADLAQTVAPARAAPLRPAARASGVLLLLYAAVGLLAALLPRVAWTQWLRFTDPYGDHPPYSPIVFAVAPGDVSVVYGDGLDVRVSATGAPVDRVELVLHSSGEAQPQMLPMFAEPSGRWRATIASVTAPGRYFVRAHSARSPRFKLDVVTVPRLENVRFRITPPAYTNEALYEGPAPQAGLAGLPGTKVEFRATSNRPLSGGKLEITTEQKTTVGDLTPVADGAAEVTGAFEIRTSGKLRFNVVDVAGQPSKESFTAAIVALPDQRPFVRVLQPQPISLATPNVNLPVQVSGEDDYGVSRLQLFRSLNDSRPLPLDFAVGREDGKRATKAAALPLARYALQSGDVIKLFARVEDNDPAGAKGAESTIALVRIISQEDFERLMRTREGLEMLRSKYEQAVRRLENLDNEMNRQQKDLKGQPAERELSAEQRAALEKLAEQMRKDAEEVERSSQFKLPYDIDQALTGKLAEMAQELAAAAQQAGKLAQQPGLNAGQAGDALDQLRARLGGKGKDFDQQVMQPLKYLAAILPLKRDEARFIQLYQRQRELADRLASLKGRDNEDDPSLKARMRDLETEQDQLRTQLGQLLDDIEEHAARLPDDPELEKLRQTAIDFAKALRESDADQAMADAAAGLAEFSGTRGYENAKRAADILEQFIGRCQSMGDQAGRCPLKFGPSLGQCLSNSLNQLLSEAGLGMGMGEGAGDGYSAQSSNLQNVGLYGALPALAGASERNDVTDTLPALSGPESGAAAATPGAVELRAGGLRHAGGVDDRLVPPRYRRRVAEYFQRIADELEQQEHKTP